MSKTQSLYLMNTFRFSDQ